jgi:ACS family glucarate transporter-like MFS transporter
MTELNVEPELGAPADWEVGAARPSRVRYQVLAFACALAVVTYVDRIGFAVGAPAIAHDLGLDEAQVGYLMAAFLLAYGAFQVPGGLLGDRLGGRGVLTMLVLGWSLLTGAVALAVLLPRHTMLPFVFLLVLRLLFGMFQAGGFPTLGRVIADWMPLTERGSAQGAIWMFSRWGGALIPFLLTWLFWFWGGWPIPFLLVAGLGLLWCGAFWPWFRNRPEEMPSVNRGELKIIRAGRAKGHDSSARVPWDEMAGSTSVWSLCLMYGFTGFSGNFFTSMLPLYLAKQRHLSHGEIAWLSALPLAAGSIACILGGAASDWAIRRFGNRKWGRRYVGFVGLALAGPSLLAVNWAESVWLLAVLLTATFFFNDLSMGPAWAACADIGERFAGTLSGTMNTISALAGAAGAAMVGYLFRAGHPELVFVIFAGVYVLAAICWLGVDVTRRLADVPLAVDLETGSRV